MIPLKDDPGARRTFPLVTVALVVVNVLAFLYELALGDGVEAFISAAGVVPAEFLCRCDLPPPDVGPFWVTLLTSQFLHGGWLHLGGNMLYLWIFGDNVEDAFGHLGYLAFYLAGGVMAGLVQVVVDPSSQVPSLGASGAIAAVLAAYVVLFPSAQVRTLLVIGPFVTVRRLSALLLIGFWFVIQLFDGLAALGHTSASEGGVAYWAHVGGFVFGLAVAMLLRGARGRDPAAAASVP
jgi:membrane associated rhomboid family serine protease